MDFKTAYSTKPNIAEAVAELKTEFSDFDAKAIMYFASTIYEPAALSKTICDAFPNTITFGCTTAGELVTGKMLDQSIVAMAFSPKILGDIKVVVTENIKNDKRAIDRAFASFQAHFGKTASDLDHNKYVGIALLDGMSGMEEKLIERIGDLTNISFVGGSVGDDLQFKATYVFMEGKAYTNAAVLAILKPKTQFSILKTQSFKLSGKKLTVTKAIEAERRVIEFDNQPATIAYSQALGIEPVKLSEFMFEHPVGLMDFKGEPFVRSPRVVEGTDVLFYCAINKGFELDILESRDIVEDTKADLEAKINEMVGISAIINFHCILRTLELKQKQQTQAYADIFGDIPNIGFSTYGECYIGHINQTSTMLVFK